MQYVEAVIYSVFLQIVCGVVALWRFASVALSQSPFHESFCSEASIRGHRGIFRISRLSLSDESWLCYDELSVGQGQEYVFAIAIGR